MARLSRTLTRAMRRRGLLVAALTAVGMFGILYVQGVLLAFLGLASMMALAPAGSSFVDVLGSQLAQVALASIPMLVGVFVALWQLAPVTEALRPGHVVARALLACGVGAIAVALTAIVAAAIVSPTGFGLDPGFAVVSALFSGLTTAVSTAPVVALAAFLSWGWQQRHPLRYELRGALDEV